MFQGISWETFEKLSVKKRNFEKIASVSRKKHFSESTPFSILNLYKQPKYEFSILRKPVENFKNIDPFFIEKKKIYYYAVLFLI